MKTRKLQTLRVAFFTMLLTLIGMSNIFAQEFTVGELKYSIRDGNNVSVIGHIDGQNAKGELVIPEKVSNKGVTYTVTSIYVSAFCLCAGLTSVTIPNTVTEISDCAFARSGITSIFIPASVTYIFKDAFRGCCDLSKIVVDSMNIRYDSRENCNAIIERSTNTLIAGCKNSIIPNTVTSIGNGAFAYCKGLTSITIPHSVTGIYNEAFVGCEGLISITIPNSVTEIKRSSFYGTGWYNQQPNGILYLNGCCLGYKVDQPKGELKIRNNTRIIAGNAFSGCSKLTSIVFPSSLISIGEFAFECCEGLTSVVFPSSLISIGAFAFEGCEGLTSVVIPNSVTSIGSYAFRGCRKLVSITIPNSVTSIGSDVFGMTSWEFQQPKGVLYLDGCCLGYHGGELKGELKIRNDTRIIAAGAFYDCKGITSVSIPKSVTVIKGNPFEECNMSKIIVDPENSAYDSRGNCNAIIEKSSNTLIIGCKSTVIPQSVTSIGASAFIGSSIASIAIPNSITSIGTWAFMNCTKLTSVTLPKSVTTIGEYAFANSGLTSVVIESPYLRELSFEVYFGGSDNLRESKIIYR